MAQDYFSQLNYTLGDEDTWVEYHMLPEAARHVMCIAGSGGRVLPLLARAPKQLTCVDILDVQLWLTEMRLEALRALEHADYLAFLGYPPQPMSAAQRETCFQRLDLSAPAREHLGALFSRLKWAPVIYMGRFEKTIITLSKIVSLFTGKRGARIFDFATLEEQRAYYASGFPHMAWKMVLFLLGNSTVLNSLLYKGDFPKKNIPQSAYAVYRDIFFKLMNEMPARNSFFLQLVFFGEVRYPEGNPVECDAAVYAAARQALANTEISYLKGDVLAAADESVDFLSLSDVPSFFKGEVETTYMQQLSEKLAPGAQVVYRGHLRIPQPDTQGFESLAATFQTQIAEERTGLWQIFPFRKKEQTDG